MTARARAFRHRFVAKLEESTALRYALAPVCVAVAVALHISVIGAFLHPTGLFLAGIVAAAWFGGAGPGFLAALLATLALPQLIAMDYPLIAGFFDLPRFLTLGMTGVAVGWGATSRRRAEAALRQSEDELRKIRNQLETKVEERTAALRSSEERYELAMLASQTGFWDWYVATDEFYVSPKLLEMGGFAPGTTFSGRADFMARAPFHPDDRAKWECAVKALFAGGDTRLAMELRVIVAGETRWHNLNGICIRDAAGAILRWTGSSTDVTARKCAEEALRLSEERYARAMEGSDAGHWDWDVATDEYYISPRHLEIAGFPPGARFKSRAQFIAQYPFHPEDRPKWEAAAAAHFAGETPRLDIEFRITPRGEVRWVHMIGMYRRDAAGKPVRWAGSVSDITERKRIEDELRMSEERYARAMEGSDAGYWEWNLASDEMFVSARAREMLCLPAGTLPATRTQIVALVPEHSDDRAAMADLDKASLASGHHERDYRVFADSGEARWLRSRAKVFRDEQGRAARMTGSLTDITERKRIEEELRARQEMLDLAQKAAQAVAFEWRIGAGKGENRWSPDLEAMYGLAPGTYDGSFETWKTLVHPEDWPSVKAAVKRAHETGDVAAEYRIRHPDGSVHWLQAKGRMILDGNRAAVRMIGFMLDVTERRTAEEDLRRLERQLRNAQRLEAVGTLASGIAHDFNNILGAILGYGEMALRDAPKGSRLRRDLDSVMVAGERGRALVERILAFSRSGMAERVAVHVEDIVREALGQLAAKLPAGVDVRMQLHAGRAALMGDPTQVHQVLMNLATNAIQAMPSGGTLQVSLDAVHLEAPRLATTGVVAGGEWLALKVADSGAGMAPEVLERIFDPFFTTKDVGVGTGLGLSLVHGIVTDLGGAIDVASTPGAGSAFTVYLPRAGDAPQEQGAQEQSMPRGNRQRVLVVDDEEPLVRFATQTLEYLGYVPVGFTSSAAALEAFRADPARFDALITDERMPGMSGTALIREVRGLRRAMPILLASGYLGSSEVNRAQNAGADEVLKKPLLARELAASLARVFQER